MGEVAESKGIEPPKKSGSGTLAQCAKTEGLYQRVSMSGVLSDKERRPETAPRHTRDRSAICRGEALRQGK